MSFRILTYYAAAVILSSVTAILLAEGALRLLVRSNSSTYVWRPHLVRTFHPLPEAMPGINGPSLFQINSLGIRGPEMSIDHKTEYRILALGGSATECLYLDQTRTWPHLIGQILHSTTDGRQVWVGNLGKSGTNTRHHVLTMQRVVSWYDVDIVLFMIGANDLGLVIGQVEDYDPYFLQKPQNLPVLALSAFSVLGDDILDPPFYKRTRLWSLARLARRELEARWAPTQDDHGLMYIKARARRQTGRLLHDLPPLAAGLDEYERNVKQLATLALEQSRRPVFLTQPALYRDNLSTQEEAMLWLGGVRTFMNEPFQAYYSPGVLARGVDAYNERLLSVCRRLQLECVDVARYIPKTLDIFYDDVHFTEKGAALVAEVVAAHLKSHVPFRSPQQGNNGDPGKGGGI